MNNYDNSKSRCADAIARLDKEIASNPKNADAYNERAVACRDQGDHERSINDFRKAIELAPKNPMQLRRGATYKGSDLLKEMLNDDQKDVMNLCTYLYVARNKEIDNFRIMHDNSSAEKLFEKWASQPPEESLDAAKQAAEKYEKNDLNLTDSVEIQKCLNVSLSQWKKNRMQSRIHYREADAPGDLFEGAKPTDPPHIVESKARSNLSRMYIKKWYINPWESKLYDYVRYGAILETARRYDLGVLETERVALTMHGKMYSRNVIWKVWVTYNFPGEKPFRLYPCEEIKW